MRWRISLAGMLVLVGIVLPLARAEAAHAATVASPTVTILQPADGDVLQGTSFTVRLQITNFKIVRAAIPYTPSMNMENHSMDPAANRPGEGHIHMVLDLWPVVALDDGSVTYTFQNVPPGPHELEVSIVNNDHSYLVPEVSQTIHFTSILASNVPLQHQSVMPADLPHTGGDASSGGAILWLGTGAMLALAGVVLRCRSTAGHAVPPMAARTGAIYDE